MGFWPWFASFSQLLAFGQSVSPSFLHQEMKVQRKEIAVLQTPGLGNLKGDEGRQGSQES